MKTKPNTQIFSFFTILSLVTLNVSAVTIWNETFESYADNTTVSTNNNTANAAIDWNRTLTGSEDYFRIKDSDDFTPITGLKSFAGDETDGSSIWETEAITITGFSNVNISLNYNEVGNQNGADFILIQYELNGNGSWATLGNGSKSNDINGPTEIASTTGLSGTTIKIRVTISCDDDDEIWFFDDILITGTVSGIPCSTCYSVANGNIDNASTWSNSSGGASGFIPLTDGTASIIVENSYTVNMNTDYAFTNVTVGASGLGNLNWTATNVQLDIMNGGTVSVINGSKIDENGQTSAQIIFNSGNFDYDLIVNDPSNGLEIDDIYIENDVTLEISGSGKLDINNNFLFNGNNARVNNNLTGLFTINNSIIWGDNTSDQDNDFINNQTIGIDNDVFFLKQTNKDSLFNFGTLTINGSIQWEDDGTTGAAANVDGYVENNGSINLGDDLHFGADDCKFINNGILTVSDQIFFYEHCDLSGVTNNSTGSITVSNGIFFQTDGNAFTNNWLYNSGNFIVINSIESFQGSITLNNYSTGNLTVGGFISQDHNSPGMFINNQGAILVSGDLRLEDNTSSMTVTNSGNLSFNDVEASNGKLDINNTGTINMSGTFINGEIDVNSDFINGINGRWNYGGTGHDPQTDLTTSATGNTFNYSRNGAQSMIDVAGDDYYHLEISVAGVKTSVEDIDIEGNLSITETASLDVDAGNDNIKIAGNWTNSSSVGFVEGTENVTFDGIGAQHITCSTILTETFDDLLIDKSAGGIVTMNNNVLISNQLTFSGSNGYLAINANNLNISSWSNGDIIGYDNKEFIIVDQIGYIKFNGVSAGEILNIPMGIGTGTSNYALADLTMTNPGSGTFDANLCGQVQLDGGICNGTALTADAVDYTWNFISTSTNANVKLYWDSGNELSSFNRNACAVLHYNGTIWEDFGSFSSAITEGGSLYSRSANVTGFSPYSVQNETIGLPIELISFSAENNDGKVLLTWVTGSEINNNFFTVEKSLDGINFETVCMLAGSGYSTSEIKYSVIDENPYQGYSYYRLKQTDYDQKFQYSDLVSIIVENPSQGASFLEVSLFPNPVAENKFFISTKCGKSNEVVVILFSLSGVEVFSKFVIIEQGETITAIDLLGKVEAGIYTVIGSSQNDLFRKTILVK